LGQKQQLSLMFHSDDITDNVLVLSFILQKMELLIYFRFPLIQSKYLILTVNDIICVYMQGQEGEDVIDVMQGKPIEE
jgi:hypothetical protein